MSGKIVGKFALAPDVKVTRMELVMIALVLYLLLRESSGWWMDAMSTFWGLYFTVFVARVILGDWLNRRAERKAR